MSWKDESQRHSLSSRGIKTAQGRLKKIKPLEPIQKLPFNYDKAGYDTETLLLIPEYANLKRHLVWDLEEYVEYLKEQSQFGEDTKMTVFFKDERPDVSFDMDDYDVDTRTITGYRAITRSEVTKRFNPSNTNHVSNIKNIIKSDTFGTYDLYGELIHDWELREIFDDLAGNKRQREQFKTYRSKNALRLKDMKWVKIMSPTNLEEI